MAEIKEQFIQAKTKAGFIERLNAGDVKDTSIAFIEDTNQIWTKGKYYSFIPKGGTKGKLLSWLEDGRAKWDDLSTLMSDLDSLQAYGVEWDTGVADPHLTRIGNYSLHRTLPIQSQIKGCIAQGGKVIYWLDENDWRFRKAPISVSVTLKVDNGTRKITADVFSTLRYEGAWVKIKDIKCNITSIDTATSTASLLSDEYVDTLLDGTYTAELGSVRNGYDGTVRVFIPEFYIKSQIEGTKRRVYIAASKIDGSYIQQQAMLVDAYRCTVLNTVPTDMGYLSTLPVNSAISVVNTNTYCRGGSNSTSYDQYLASDPRKTQLGKPRTNISRATMRADTQAAGSNMLSYTEYKNIFYWLYVIEYANFNSQEDFLSSLTDEGYRQGGLGAGVTTMNGNVWQGYNNYCPLTPCGFLDSLGNGSGISPQLLGEFDMSITSNKNWGWSWTTYMDNGTTKNNAIATQSGSKMTITNVKNIGDIFYTTAMTATGNVTYTIAGLTGTQKVIFRVGGKVDVIVGNGTVTINWGTDGAQTRTIRTNFNGACNFSINIDSVETVTTKYPAQTITVNRWRGFDNPFGDIWTNLDGILVDADANNHANNMNYVYVCTDPTKYADSLNESYSKAGEEIHQDGGTKEFDLGEEAHIIPNVMGGGFTTYKCDYHWTGDKNTSLRTVFVGGGAHDGAYAGLGYFYSYDGVGAAWLAVGFRSVSVFSN